MSNKYILGIETSCDDTAIGYISLNGEVVKHYTYNQIEHVKFRGVVPTLAARKHLDNIQDVMKRVLEDISIDDIVGVAVTVGPGLIASLMIGVNYAKMLAHILNVKFIPIHHLEGHIFSVYIHRCQERYEYNRKIEIDWKIENKEMKSDDKIILDNVENELQKKRIENDRKEVTEEMIREELKKLIRNKLIIITT